MAEVEIYTTPFCPYCLAGKAPAQEEGCRVHRGRPLAGIRPPGGDGQAGGRPDHRAAAVHRRPGDRRLRRAGGARGERRARSPARPGLVAATGRGAFAPARRRAQPAQVVQGICIIEAIVWPDPHPRWTASLPAPYRRCCWRARSIPIRPAASSAGADGSSASKPSSSRHRCSKKVQPTTTRCRPACNLAATPSSSAASVKVRGTSAKITFATWPRRAPPGCGAV